MENFDQLVMDDLEIIFGGSDYRGIFDWKTYLIYIKNRMTVVQPPQSNCVNYHPAYPGKVLPAC